MFPRAHTPVIGARGGHIAQAAVAVDRSWRFHPDRDAPAAITHPPSDRVETFYDESERRSGVLASTDKPSFLALLDALARHQPFETALPRIYAGTFQSPTVLEGKFREYAAKDSTSEQSGGE